MSFRRKPALSAREIWILVGLAAATFVLANTLIGVDILLSRTLPGGGAFFSGWVGARVLLWQHANPYGEAVVSMTQRLAYGRPAGAGENPFILTIPLYLLPIYFPFAATSASILARGLWIAVGQAALAGAALLNLTVVEWHPPRGLVLALGGVAVLGLYSSLALLDGAPSVLLVLLYVAIIWAYGNERDELAGAMLVLCWLDWEAGALFVLLVLARIFQDRRWNVLAGAGMALVVLGIVSFLIFPAWPIPFLAATLASIRVPFGVTTAAGLEQLFPGQGPVAGQLLAVMLAIVLIAEWWGGRQAGFRRFIWTACLALTLTPLMGFRSELSNLVTLVPSIVLICAASSQRPRYGVAISAGFLAVTFFLPWFLEGRWLILGDARAHDFLFLILPVLTLLGLYWIRWWYVRPQQTWLDQVRASRGGG